MEKQYVEIIREIDDSISKVRELFDIAFEYNKNDDNRTELSQKCTTYLVDVRQILGAIRDKLIEDLIEE